MPDLLKHWSYTHTINGGRIKAERGKVELDSIEYPERYGRIVGEVGYLVVSQTDDNDVVFDIRFRAIYRDPVVIPYVASFLGPDPTTVRVIDVRPNGATLKMIDANLTGHMIEVCCYLVAEKGRWLLDGEIEMEVGTFETNIVHREGQTPSGEHVSFMQSFSSKPAVLHALQTYNNGSFMETAIYDISTDGFYGVQEAGGTGVSATTETIGYVALTTGKGTTAGWAYEIGYANDGANDGVDDSPHKISFSSFTKRPIVVVKGQTLNGYDGYWARGQNYSNTDCNVYAEEDTVGDTEQSHADETFGWLAIEEGALLIAVEQLA